MKATATQGAALVRAGQNRASTAEKPAELRDAAAERADVAAQAPAAAEVSVQASAAPPAATPVPPAGLSPLPGRTPGDKPASSPSVADPLLPPPSVPDEAIAQHVAAKAEEARAEVLERHRREWRVIRGLLSEGVNRRDTERTRLAKTAAETLKISQEGERRAWGLDVTDPLAPQGLVRIVVEREGVAASAPTHHG